jgi:hypothetical protein
MTYRDLRVHERWILIFIIFFIFVSCQAISQLSNGSEFEGIPTKENVTTSDKNLVENRITETAPVSTQITSDESFQIPSITLENNQNNFTLTDDITFSATIPPSATPYPVTRFAVIGDYGESGKPEQEVAELIKSWNPDFIITTGDNNYPDGKFETIDENIGKYFQEYIFPYTGEFGDGADINRFFPSMGNHDWSITRGKAYWEYFTLPGNERYYDFTWGPVHLFAIDSDSREPDGVGRSSIQAEWLREKLGTSEAVWKIVYMHHPPYASSGDDGSVDWMQWPYKEWGVTVVLSGHSHVYERLIVDGFPYFVNGLGGGSRYDFNDPVPGSQVRFRSDYGAMLVEATIEQISFQFITRDNVIIDTYIIEAGN